MGVSDPVSVGYTIYDMIVGIGKKLYGFGKISCLKINLAIGFTRKNQLECIGKAVMMLYLG